jgi:hypothetical protein
MTLVRVILASAHGRIVLAVVACYLAWQAWLSLSAPGKISPALATDRQRVNVLVTLSFPPERFHVLAFQRFGRVSGTENNSVEVRGVNRENLTALARPYWVRRIDAIAEGG